MSMLLLALPAQSGGLGCYGAISWCQTEDDVGESIDLSVPTAL